MGMAVAGQILPIVGGIGFEPTTFPMSTECSKPSELTTLNGSFKTTSGPFMIKATHDWCWPFRAHGGTRTPMPESTTPSRWRVYLFHHMRKMLAD